MWLVVKPSFGIPFFLSVVAIVSLIVHFSILTHTTWFPGFLQGGKKTAVVATP
jgi:light-harvesting protein B-800-850 alpha chain